MADLRVGGTLWFFDVNRRHYAKPAPGRVWGEMIYRQSWVERHIVGETRTSWLVLPHKPSKGVTYGPRETIKLAKAAFANGGCPQGWALDEAHVDRLTWVHDHRPDLSRLVLECDSYEKLRAVAEAIGYVPPPAPKVDR